MDEPRPVSLPSLSVHVFEWRFSDLCRMLLAPFRNFGAFLDFRSNLERKSQRYFGVNVTRSFPLYNFPISVNLLLFCVKPGHRQ